MRLKCKAQAGPSEAESSKQARTAVAAPIPSSQEQKEAIDSFSAAMAYQFMLNIQADINAMVESARHRVANMMLASGFDFDFTESSCSLRKGLPTKGKGKGKARE